MGILDNPSNPEHVTGRIVILSALAFLESVVFAVTICDLRDTTAEETKAIANIRIHECESECCTKIRSKGIDIEEGRK